MTISLRIGLACAAILLGSACGGDDSSQDVQVLRADLQSVRDEVTRHEQTCLSALTLEDISADATWHEQQMSVMLSDLNGALDGMSHCSAQGMGRMHGRMDGMHQELDGHMAQLDATATLDSARGQCAQYSGVMNQMLDDAQAELGQMGGSCRMMGMMMR